MGKKSREKRERKELPVELDGPLTNRASMAQEREIPSPQRRKLLIGAGAGLAAAAGGSWYASMQGNKEDAASVNGYISVNDAVKLYGELEKQVKVKQAQAQREHKPLRLVVMENHDSTDALAHEIMLVDIADRLGIHTLLTEIGSNSKETLLHLDANQALPQIANKHRLLQFADKKGFAIENTDTRYAVQTEYARDYYALSKSHAEELLRQRFPGSEAVVTIIPPEDLNNMLFSFSISGHIQVQDKEEAGKLVEVGRLKALEQIDEVRNQFMTKTLRQYGDSVVTMGVKHGVSLLTALRNAGDSDLAFYITEPELAQKYKAGPMMSQHAAQSIAWASDPANAIQYHGKSFNPQNFDQFMERTINKAHDRGFAR